MSTGSNPLSCCFQARAFLLFPRHLTSLSCINEYLAVDSGGNVSEQFRTVIEAWLNASKISKIGVGMNRSARR